VLLSNLRHRPYRHCTPTSALGTNQTLVISDPMSAFGGEADATRRSPDVGRLMTRSDWGSPRVLRSKLIIQRALNRLPGGGGFGLMVDV
jgi:hypothetical protein